MLAHCQVVGSVRSSGPSVRGWKGWSRDETAGAWNPAIGGCHVGSSPFERPKWISIETLRDFTQGGLPGSWRHIQWVIGDVKLFFSRKFFKVMMSSCEKKIYSFDKLKTSFLVLVFSLPN